MRTSKVTSREFNQDTSKAKKAAQRGPVVITDRGQPAHVLMTYAQYQRLAGKLPSISELLALPGAEDIPFEPGVLRDVAVPADFD